MPFINIEKAKRTKILNNKIDVENYLGLSNNRIDLTAMGVALGIDRPVSVILKDNLLRQEYVENNFLLRTIITCGAIYTMNDNDDLNDVLSNENIFKNASECLNRGLDIIENQINSYPASNHRLKLIEELEELYDETIVE